MIHFVGLFLVAEEYTSSASVGEMMDRRTWRGWWTCGELRVVDVAVKGKCY